MKHWTGNNDAIHSSQYIRSQNNLIAVQVENVMADLSRHV